MPAVNGKMTSFLVTAEVQKVIDDARRIHYTKSQSEVIRMLITEGAKELSKKKKGKN